MQKITYKKLNYKKLPLFIFLFFISFQTEGQNTIDVTGVTICKGGSGTLTVNSPVATTTSSKGQTSTFKGHWNSKTDPTAITISSSTKNSAICDFYYLPIFKNYTAISFKVNVSGIYMFKMTDTNDYDGAAYIYTGNFTPGLCSGGGTWIIGDDDYDGSFTEPRMTAYFDAGVTYTLISTLWGFTEGTYEGDYTWTVTSPPKGNFLINTLNYWYTSKSGGIPIGLGDSFNPVGVQGSGLLDTNTPGTTTYYVSNGETSDRTPVDFVIKEELIVTQIAFQTCIGSVYDDFIINEVTRGKVTGIGTPTNLPSGLHAFWSASDNTIKINGVITEENDLWYSIPLITEDCGVNNAIGIIKVNPKPADKVTNMNICFGETYIWPADGTKYTTAGTYKIANDGCTADQILNLTVTPKPTDVITTKTICSDEKYTWPANGVEYSTSQAGIRIEKDACTADQILNLIVTPKPAVVIKNIVTCNVGYTRIITNDGCTADEVHNYIQIPKPDDIVTNKTICSGETYIWPADGTKYTTAGTYKITSIGCYADEILKLTVTPKPTDLITNKTICSGEKYTWPANGVEYSTSQNGLKIIGEECTADQVLNLTVTPKPVDLITNKNLCAGTTYKWDANGVEYSTSQSAIRIKNDGCTADQVLNLTVGSKPADIVTTESICSGQTYTWPANGIEYSSSTSLKIKNDGCTADQVLNLTVTPKPADIIKNLVACEREGVSYPRINKVVNDGCTADVVYNYIIILKPTSIVTDKTICFGENYLWNINNITYNSSGTYTNYDDDCTEDQVLNLTVEDKPSDIVTTKSICSGESYKWINDITYTTSQTGLRISNDGCTADQVLNLTITPKPANIVTTESICSGQTYTWPANGIEYSSSTSLKIKNDGCTADQVLNLTVGAKPADIVTTESICSGQTYTWSANGIKYSSSTSFKIENDGCTADQVLNLTVGSKPADIVTTESICSGQTYTWLVDGNTYNTSGTYRKNSDECTADQVLNLTVVAKPADIVSIRTICSGDNYLWYEPYIYNKTGRYKRINDGCTPDHILVLDVTPKPADIVTTESICSGQTYIWQANGIEYSSSTFLKIENDGCTADQVLNLTVDSKPADIVTTESICAGQTYTWPANGIKYSSSTSLKIENDGCTADQVLNLTVGAKPADIVTTESICSGQTYTWPANGIEYFGSTSLKIKNDGCTADQVLNLTVGSKTADIVTTESICAGQTYTWPANGIEYSSSTSLKIKNDGCTADQVLNLTVGSKPADIVTTESICYGETYFWPVNEVSYTSSANLKIENDGCTADEILNLIVSSPLTSELIPNTLLRETCYGEQDGAFSIQITGGMIPYKVALNNIDGVYQSVADSDYTFSNLAGGQYIVYIKDALDCIIEQVITVVDGVSINPVVNINYTCENNSPANSVTITIDQSNINVNDMDYALDGDNFQTDTVFKNLSPGSHTITARHLNGCLENTESFVIDFAQPLNLSLTNTELNEITASGENGSGNYQYSFEGESFSTNNKFIIYKSGTYNITVRDQSGCTFSTSKYFDYIDLCIPNYFTPNGDGVSDYWGPDCESSYKNLTYTIFDRYGRELANYHFGQKWDGKYKGQELTSGDYWYVIKLNDSKDNREFVGHFTLYR